VQNLNSDELRKRLGENNATMNTLTEDNQKIVDLLADRGLQATEKTIFKVDRIWLTDPAGNEILNTDWHNPFVKLETHEIDHCSLKIDAAIKPEPREETKAALTADELKAGGWWCADISRECALAFIAAGVDVHNSKNWTVNARTHYGWGGCTYLKDEVTRTNNRYTKQIHRIGNDFFWGAPK